MDITVIFLDYPSKGKSGYGPLGADTVFRMLECSTDTENSICKMRQKEGIVLAKESGISFGRQEKATLEFKKAYNKWINKEISAKEAADICGIHTATFYRRAQKMKE